METTYFLGVAFAAFFIAGTIKGIAGLGLPTAAIAGMSLVIGPRAAIALMLFPMLGLNGWQWLKAGHLIETARRYWVFALVLLVGVTITTFAAKDVPDRGLMAALGVTILLFVASSWGGWLPKLNPKYDLIAQTGFAVFAGIIGGLTAAWAAPMGMYLSMCDVKKEEFIRASGFLITIGSLPLCLAYVQLGFLTQSMIMTSLGMFIPALLGFSLGEWVRRHLSQEYFRQAILCVFLLLALNLLRRAVWYA